MVIRDLASRTHSLVLLHPCVSVATAAGSLDGRLHHHERRGGRSEANCVPSKIKATEAVAAFLLAEAQRGFPT